MALEEKLREAEFCGPAYAGMPRQTQSERQPAELKACAAKRTASVMAPA
jgi:hypothetical protein